MLISVKILTSLAFAATLAACAASPEKSFESTYGQSRIDPSLVIERNTLSDKQGVSTLKVVQKNGVTIKADWVDESSTSEQDTMLTMIGAATGPLINGVMAHSLQSRAKNCGNGNNCGGGGQQVVQVQVDSNSSSSAGTSQAGCATCGSRKKLPSKF